MTAGMVSLGGHETDLELEALQDALGETGSGNKYDRSILFQSLRWSDYPEANDMVAQLECDVIDVGDEPLEDGKPRSHLTDHDLIVWSAITLSSKLLDAGEELPTALIKFIYDVVELPPLKRTPRLSHYSTLAAFQPPPTSS